MEFRVLGRIEVVGPRQAQTPPGAKERAILARLLLDPGRAVPADALLEAAWEPAAREAAARSLPVRIANLRAFLEPGRPRGEPSQLLVRDGPGYRLAIAPAQVDAHRFERLVLEQAGLPAAEALTACDRALALWRGEPYGELAGADFAQAEVRRLHDLRTHAETGRARALVDLGRPLEALPELQRLVAHHPVDEEPVRLLMRALYGAGRQVEALEAYRALAARLVELGLQPAAATRALEQRILDQDPALRPLAPAPARHPVPAEARRPAPLGRTAELARLRAAWAAAGGGARRMAMLCGEPGAGKTTLAEALALEAAAGGRGLAAYGQCVEHRGPGEPYLPVLEALAGLARGPGGSAVLSLLAERAPTWLVELPWLLDAPALAAVRERAQGATRTRMLREMLEAVDALAAVRPVLLVLEDLHWADDSTLDLLGALARRREPARLLVLCSFRPPGLDAGAAAVAPLVRELCVRGLCEEIAVGRLEADAVAAYLRRRLAGQRPPAGATDLLHRRSGGNPLFMGNLVDFWEGRGLLRADADLAALEAGVPATLRAHLEDRLGRLAADDAELLQAAGVAGRTFTADTLAAALGRERAGVEARCAVLSEETRLIEPRGGGHAFSHDLQREVLYASVPPEARARLHARVGAHLAAAYGDRAPEHAAELGFHFVAGRDPERAVRFLRLAADRAFGRNAHPEGIRHLRAALDAVGHLAAGRERTRAEVEVLSSLGQAAVATGGWSDPEAEAALLRARALATELQDDEPLVAVLLALATLYELRGEFGRSHAVAQECVRRLPDGAGPQALESTELLACNLFHQGAFAQALEYAERGVALFEAGGAPGTYSTFPATLGDNAGVSCHDWAGLALWFMGHPDEALQRARRALELARDPSRAYALATARAQMAVVHQCRQEPLAALEWAEATIACAQRLGYAYREAMGRVLRGWALAMLGDHPQGLVEMTEGLAASRATGARMDDPHYLGLLAEAHLSAGAVEAGRLAVREALEIAGRERSLFYEPELHRLAGLLHAEAGEVAAAQAALRAGLARARRQRSRSLELRIAADLARVSGGDAVAAG